MSNTLVFDYGFARPDRLVQAMRSAQVPVRLSSSAHDIRAADRLVLPDGDDRASSGGLNRQAADAIRSHVERGKPTLTVGLGSMFLMQGRIHEGASASLGLFKAPITIFDPRMADEEDRPLKAPHVGYSFVVGLDRHPLFASMLPEDDRGLWFYFRHRLCAPARVPFADVAVAHHGVPFAGAIWRSRVLALQFLPELSGTVGIRLLKAWGEGA